jgi:hypothetical protein
VSKRQSAMELAKQRIASAQSLSRVHEWSRAGEELRKAIELIKVAGMTGSQIHATAEALRRICDQRSPHHG